MFSSVYVILPFSEIPPGEAIAASLAPYRQGTRDEGLPPTMLAFEDETEAVMALYTATLSFERVGRGGLSISGGDSWYLDTEAVRAAMQARGLARWTVQLAEVEPDLQRFFDRFVTRLERHPRDPGRFGLWRNPLGRWDWWDLGGRHDGQITGTRRPGGGRAPISSGPARGRDLLAQVTATLADAIGQKRPTSTDVDITTDLNIELVARLSDDARAGLDHAFPNAVLLPPGSLSDALRWLGTWPDLGPAAAIRALGLADGAAWATVVLAAYDRFPDHWAGCVSYHH